VPRWRSASDRMVRIAMQFGMGIWKIEFLARVLYRESGVCVACGACSFLDFCYVFHVRLCIS
jgi:hypothetical protein